MKKKTPYNIDTNKKQKKNKNCSLNHNNVPKDS